MANKPVFGIMKCPYCRFQLPIAWDGNFTMKCSVCGKPFKVKRQKLTRTTPIHKRGAEDG